MSKLFLDSPAQLEKRIERLVQHFRHAETVFYAKFDKGIPSPSALLWLLIEEAMHTARNTPRDDLRMISRMPTLMPGVRVTDAEAYHVELSRLLDHMPQYDAKEVRENVGEAARDRMVDVLDLFRFVQGPAYLGEDARRKEARRLKRVVLARASGLSLEQCGRIWDKHRTSFDRRSMHDIKSRVLGQILKGIEDHFGLKRTSRGFRRLTVREIERLAKARKRREAEANA